ncbi:MAG TPA: hypothetical protein PLJ35_02565 [Anaerolineae bacterium]|nr:hypothetical protein [Anaerolineae bacterium]HOQ97687.1 hypothetical protein [Anaerolineae bacterium]HPL29481.1 hypothetical protein [Anaerolineae bacterium]
MKRAQGPSAFRVHGREIVESNAHEIEGNTAIWRYPGAEMSVTLKPLRTSFLANVSPLAKGALAVTGVAGTVAAAIWVFRGSLQDWLGGLRGAPAPDMGEGLGDPIFGDGLPSAEPFEVPPDASLPGPFDDLALP